MKWSNLLVPKVSTAAGKRTLSALLSSLVLLPIAIAVSRQRLFLMWLAQAQLLDPDSPTPMLLKYN